MHAASNEGENCSLRQRAELQAKVAGGHREPLSLAEAQKLLHELEVHQIELELQNEELRRSQVELEKSKARYFEFYDLAPSCGRDCDAPHAASRQLPEGAEPEMQRARSGLQSERHKLNVLIMKTQTCPSVGGSVRAGNQGVFQRGSRHIDAMAGWDNEVRKL